MVEGGAPSLRITPQEFSPIDGVTLNRSPCYFSVFESEFRFCQSIPSLGSPSRPLRFEEWKSSGKKVCSFCKKFDHNFSICEERKKHNHPACWRCGSFAHQTPQCTNTNTKCILCRDAKHTARNCPLYVGTYRKVGTKPANPPTTVWKGVPFRNQSVVGNKSYAAIAAVGGGDQQQQQHYQQNDTQQQQHQHEINVLKDTITELKGMLQEQVKQNNTLMQKIISQQDIIMRLVSKALNIDISDNKDNGIDIQTNTHVPVSQAMTASVIAPSPAMTAKPSIMPPPKVRTPGPKSNYVDLAAQPTILESLAKSQKPTPSPSTPRTPSQPSHPSHTTPADMDMTPEQALTLLT